LRDKFLAFAAMILVGCLLLEASGDLLRIIDSVQTESLTGFVIGGVFALLSSLAGVPAFLLLAIAMLAPPSRRQARIATVAAVLTASFVLDAIGNASYSATAGTNGFPGKLVANTALSATQSFVLTVGAVLALIAFLQSAHSSESADSSGRSTRKRDGLLAWTSGCIAVAFIPAAIASVLLAMLFAEFDATQGLTTGVGIGAAGSGILAGAGVLTAIAFGLSRNKNADWGAGRRDRMLGPAAIVFATGFLVACIAGIVFAAAEPANGFSGMTTAADWLSAFSSLGFAVAASAAAVGFFLSYESSARAVVAR
jgi:hypothetical protein